MNTEQIEKRTNQWPWSEGLMGVRFCLICVKTVVLLPFLWHPQPGLWPPRLEGGCTPEPCAKLQWWFWCQGVWRRGLSSHLPLFLGSPEEGGQGVPPLDPWQAQPAEGCPTTLRTLFVVHRQVGAVLPSSNTWNSGVHCPHQTNKTPGECSSWWSRTNRQLWGDWHLPGAVELYSSPPKAHTMETLCSYCACQHHKARWKWPQWRCQVRRNYVFALLSRLNLIFHAPKGTSSCSETFVAQSRRKLSSAIRFVFSKNAIFFRTS